MEANKSKVINSANDTFKQLEQEVKEVENLPYRERFCFRCGKDRKSIVGVGGNWFYNPIAQRSLCDTKDKDGYATCHSSLVDRTHCDECNRKFVDGEPRHNSLNSDFHLECWEKYKRITGLFEKYEV